jgi:hypothetical protein
MVLQHLEHDLGDPPLAGLFICGLGVYPPAGAVIGGWVSFADQHFHSRSGLAWLICSGRIAPMKRPATG